MRAAPALLALALAAGCAGGPAGDALRPVPAPPSPEYAGTGMEREAEPLPPSEVIGPEGVFTAQVPGTLTQPVEEGEERLKLLADVGAEAPLHCWVYLREVDLASELWRATVGVLGRPPVIEYGLVAIDAGSFGASPWLEVAWGYGAEEDDGSVEPGLLKAAMAERDGGSLLCMHDEHGYRTTFRRAFAMLASTLELRDVEPKAALAREIAVLSVDGLAIGVRTTELVPEGEAELRVVTRHASLSPVGSTLMASDSAETQTLDRDGALLGARFLQRRNGVSVSALRIDPGAGGAWQVRGAFLGEKLEAALGPETPSSVLARRAVLAEMATGFAGAEVAHSLREWVPVSRPQELSTVEVAVTAARDDGLFEGSVSFRGPEAGGGGATHALLIDAQGDLVESRSNVQGEQLLVRRVYHAGRFASPR